ALVFDANAPWSIGASGDDRGPGSHVDVSVENATLGGRSLDAPTAEKPPAPLRLERTTFTLRSTSRDTAGDWQTRGGAVALGRAVAPELRMLNEVSPSLPVRFIRGSGEVAGRAAYDDGVLTADGRATLDDTIALVAGQEIRGSLDFFGTMKHF